LNFAPLLYGDELKVAIFKINLLGPFVPAKDIVNWNQFKGNHGVDDYLQKLATFTLVGVTQGQDYPENVALFPVNKVKSYRMIVISILIGSPELEIHERYVQIALFLPSSKLHYLPNLVKMEKTLISISKDLLGKDEDINITSILRLKVGMLNYLNEQLPC
jgi:hypothetical protein